MRSRSLRPSWSFSAASRARLARSSLFLFFSSIVVFEDGADLENLRANLQKCGHDNDRLFTLNWGLDSFAASPTHAEMVAPVLGRRKMARSDMGEEDHVLAASVRAAVEPAVAGLDLEAGLFEK